MQKEQKDTVESSMMIIDGSECVCHLQEVDQNGKQKRIEYHLICHNSWICSTGDPVNLLRSLREKFTRFYTHVFSLSLINSTPSAADLPSRSVASPLAEHFLPGDGIALDKELYSFVEIDKGSMRFEQVGIFKNASPIASDLVLTVRFSKKGISYNPQP